MLLLKLFNRFSNRAITGTVLVVMCILSGCIERPLKSPDDICQIFSDRPQWQVAIKRSIERWGVPPEITVSIVYQESSFRSEARPPRRKLLWIIPWKRLSTAFGYAQAIDATWARYQRDVGSVDADRTNFADAVALGLTPLTVCSDLLKVGGYCRSSAYFKELNSRMDKLGVNDIESYIFKSYGNSEKALENIGLGSDNATGDACHKVLEDVGELRKAVGNNVFQQLISEIRLLNTKTYVKEVTTHARYGFEKNSTPPRKVGTMLELFDCLTCDKCIPVCPNDANFALKISPCETEVLEFQQNNSGWSVHGRDTLKLEKKYQIANFADFCNECGNCDIFCPEDGGPFLLKPRFFGTKESFEKFTNHDGFFLEHNTGPGHPERAARLESCLKALKNSERLSGKLNWSTGRPATQREILRCHQGRHYE